MSNCQCPTRTAPWSRFRRLIGGTRVFPTEFHRRWCWCRRSRAANRTFDREVETNAHIKLCYFSTSNRKFFGTSNDKVAFALTFVSRFRRRNSLIARDNRRWFNAARMNKRVLPQFVVVWSQCRVCEIKVDLFKQNNRRFIDMVLKNVAFEYFNKSLNAICFTPFSTCQYSRSQCETAQWVR